MNRDGGGPRVLTAQLDRDVAHPLWARDGSGIFFLYDERGNTKLGFTTLDGRIRTVASDIGGPGGTYGDGTYSTGGRRGFAITYSRPSVPCDVGVGSADGSPVKIITAVNQDLLEHKTLADVDEHVYEPALARSTRQGWI